MSDYVPSSELGKAMAKLRRMVALSAVFQSKLSGGGYSAALERVMYEGVPDEGLAQAENTQPLDSLKPFGSIWLLGTGWDAVSGGQQIQLRARGQLHLYLMTPRNQAMNNWNDRRLEAVDFLENWTQDILSLSGADDTSPVIAGEGHLAINQAEIPVHEHVPQELQKSTGDFFFRHLAVSFGDSAAGGG